MFGVSSFCLHAVPLETALEQLARITRYVEIMDDGPHFLHSSELLERYSLRFSIHAPCRSVNIASTLEPIRRASAAVIVDAFRIAGQVNAPVVIHPGYFTWPGEKDAALRQFRVSLRELARAADEVSVRFFIENMGNWDYFFLRTPDEVGIADAVPLALDVGHAHLNHCLEGFLAMPAAHYHLHDNNGTEDAHLSIGSGTIPFDQVLNAVRRDRVAPIIEVSTFDGVRESIQVLDRLHF
jgi:sugar phosphate isomerase/epimerase